MYAFSALLVWLRARCSYVTPRTISCCRGWTSLPRSRILWRRAGRNSDRQSQDARASARGRDGKLAPRVRGTRGQLRRWPIIFVLGQHCSPLCRTIRSQGAEATRRRCGRGSRSIVSAPHGHGRSVAISGGDLRVEQGAVCELGRALVANEGPEVERRLRAEVTVAGR
jgi:hypothetical protein